MKAMEDLPATYFTLLGPSLKLVMTWVVQWMWVNEWGSQWYFQRTAAARSVSHAKRGFIATAAALTVMVLVPGTVIGMMARTAFPALSNSEQSLSLMIAASPVIFGALAMTGVFAAAMSTVDGCAMGAVTVLVRDFYQRALGHTGAEAKKVNRVSRVVTVCVLASVLLMATSLKSVVSGLNFLFVFSSGNFGALIGALYWKKACKEGALLSIVSAGVVAMIWTFTGNSARFDGIWWSMVISMVVMVAVSLIVSRTGSWWGKENPAKSGAKEEILDFLSNRTAAMADFIDRFDIDSMEIRLAVSELVMEKKIVEIDYMTYTRSEHSSPEQEFTADSSPGRDVIMILIALVCVAAFCLIWFITA